MSDRPSDGALAPDSPDASNTPEAPATSADERSAATRPDPGSPLTLVIAAVLAAVLFLTTAYLQNRAPEPLPEETPLVVPGEGSAGTEGSGGADAVEGDAEPAPLVNPPAPDQFTITAKLFMKMRQWVAADPKSMGQIEQIAVTRAQRVRLVVLAAELEDYQSATDRALGLSVEFAQTDPALAEDAELFAQIYAAGEGSTDGVDALTDDERGRLLAHHGYFGELALTAGRPDTDPSRAPLVSGGVPILLFFLLVLGLFGLAVFAGLVLLVIGIVRIGSGKLRWRMPVPEAGGSVYLETFALFVGGFLAMKLVTEALATTMGETSAFVQVFPLVAQWGLLLTIFWPLVRKMGVKRWAGTVGFHRGEGLFREIGCGIIAYLAALPLYLLSIMLVLVLLLVRDFFAGGDAGPPPSNPLIEIVGGAPWWAILMFFALATVWAPLVEETIFRGGLYRFTRSYLPAWVVAPLAAVPFAFLHNYGPLFTPPLIMLGLVFGLMREWRGSLIAPITAHLLHNATVISILIVTVRFLVM